MTATNYVHADAELSPCGTWRYTLTREWDATEPTVLFVLLNPSKADARTDDPTLKKGVAFAKAWGFGRVVFVNLYAFRSTDPEALREAADPVGPENDWYVAEQAQRVGLIVLAWGAHAFAENRALEMLHLLYPFRQQCVHLGLTKDGHPKHPLYLKGSTKHEPWTNWPVLPEEESPGDMAGTATSPAPVTVLAPAEPPAAPAPPLSKPALVLTQDQQNVIGWLNAGYNVFLTGVGGTGKTTAINHWLAQVPKDRFVGITASTGIAATHISGSTLHSWLGATPERDTLERLVNAAWRNKHADRLRAAHALVIDEVSMVSAKLFTLAEQAHRCVRESARPWGGMQIVLVGDLGQLPPVDEEAGWCFHSPAWGESNIHVLELTQALRYEDQYFANVLRHVRVGHVDGEVLRALGSRVNAYDPNGPGVVRLMTHNTQVDAVNAKRLALVPGEVRCYRAHDSGEEPYLSQLRRACLSPDMLMLKVGARVMFTKNDTDYHRWVNGTVGEVVEMDAHTATVRIARDGGVVRVEPATWERKQWEGNTLRVVAARSQLPLRLAYAMTIHKSAGMTIDRVSMNLADTFAPGQAYVALSRARRLDGINIEAWNGAASIMAHPLLRATVQR
jgi:hypothetical protein